MTQQVVRYSNAFIHSILYRTRVKLLLSLFCSFMFHVFSYRHMTESFLQLGIFMLALSFLCGFVVSYKLFSISHRHWQRFIVLPIISISLGYTVMLLLHMWIPKNVSELQASGILAVLFYIMFLSVRKQNMFVHYVLQSFISLACAYAFSWCLPYSTFLFKDSTTYVSQLETIASYQGLWMLCFFLIFYIGVFRNRFMISNALLFLGILILGLYRLDKHEIKRTFFWQDVIHNLNSGVIITGIFACYLCYLSYTGDKQKRKTSK